MSSGGRFDRPFRRPQHGTALTARSAVHLQAASAARRAASAVVQQNGGRFDCPTRLFVDRSFRGAPSGRFGRAKRLLFRGVRRCPSAKRLWLDAARRLRPVMAAAELRGLLDMMLANDMMLAAEVPD